MICVGVDPGLTGAIGILGHKAELLGVHDLPVMARQGASAYVKNQVNGAAIEQLLRAVLADYDKTEVRFFLETPIAFPDQQISTVASSFLTAGIIEGVITARHYTLELVAPAAWKKALGLKKEKALARTRAIRFWPDAPLALAKHHNRAESLLIAKYGWDRCA